MNTPTTHKLRTLVSTTLALVALVYSGWLIAAPPIAGEIIAIRGKVTASAGLSEIRLLRYEDRVFEGETIVTAANSYVKIRFTDDGHVYLRPNSRFLIERFNNAKDQKNDKSIFSLLKGGFRFITGLIGKRNKENVRVKTPVATIGIRGTDFTTRLCLADCFELESMGLRAPTDGLYVATLSGATIINDQLIPAGQSAFTSSTDFETSLLPSFPEVFNVDKMPNPSYREEPTPSSRALPSPTLARAAPDSVTSTGAGTQVTEAQAEEPQLEDVGFEIPQSPVPSGTIICD